MLGFGFGKVGTAAKILSLISLKCESSVLSYLFDADSSCWEFPLVSVLPVCIQKKLHVALSALISNHCSPPSLQTSVPLWANAASGQVHVSTSEAISNYVQNSQVVG